jgi:cyclopropane fatty-acyl-phospholipid synthase-like methyltransferase
MFAHRSTFSARVIRGDDDGYLAFHAPRYAYVLERLDALGVHESSRLLDIGPSRLTTLIHERFGCTVDSLGFGADHSTESGQHYEFDLNRAQDRAGWRSELPRYDVVVMAEVLEHLHTAPPLVMCFVRTLVASHGVLLLQTPNAASLSKRLKLLAGRNPFEMIRVDTANPGHFREYTRAELQDIARGAGFVVERSTTQCYFDMRYGLHTAEGNRPRPIKGTLMNVVYRALPSGLRYGISMEWRLPADAGRVVTD